MALTITTDQPRALLSAIRDAIRAGVVATWNTTPEGYFTHTAASGQWRNRAWLKPVLSNTYLRLYIVRPKNRQVSKVTYAVYHGRFAEMILTHFDDRCTQITASADPLPGDLV